MADRGRRSRLLPPVYFFAALAAMVLLDRFLPLATLIEPPLADLVRASFIVVEERTLEETLGAAYADGKSRVLRWI